jgi:hypothetical protein
METNEAKAEMALAMGSSPGPKAPTVKAAAKKTAKKGTAAANITAKGVSKMIDETNTTEEKMKILTENGIKATGAEIEPAWESFA